MLTGVGFLGFVGVFWFWGGVGDCAEISQGKEKRNCGCASEQKKKGTSCGQ